MDSDTLSLLAAIDAGAIGAFRRQRRNSCLATAASLIHGNIPEKVTALRGHISALYRHHHVTDDSSARSWVVQADAWSPVDLCDRQIKNILMTEIQADPISAKSCLNPTMDHLSEHTT